MSVSSLVRSGAFSSVRVDAEDERVKPSSLLLTQSQRDRIQARNQLATSRHVHNRKCDENISEDRRKNSTTLQRPKTLKSKRSVDDMEKSFTEKPKLRDLKQKELVAKREYLRKLQDKERENNSILNVSKLMLKHHQQVLQKERQTAIALLSKLETVLAAESEPKASEELRSSKTNRFSEANPSTRSSPRNQPIPVVTIAAAIKTNFKGMDRNDATSVISSQQNQLFSVNQHFCTHSSPNFLPPALGHPPDSRPLHPVSNTVPFSAQLSFVEEDIEKEEEDSSSQPFEAQQSHEEEPEDVVEDNDFEEELSLQLPVPAVPRTAPEVKPVSVVATKPSVISKIWGMNTDDDFNEVSEGEWSS